MKVTAVYTEPTFVIELSQAEAVGLNTLLRYGTSVSLDEALGIDGLQDLLISAFEKAGVTKVTKGQFKVSLTSTDLI